MIREAQCLAKLDIELPIVAATLLCKQSHFHAIQDSLNVGNLNWLDFTYKIIELDFLRFLQDLINMFLTTVKEVKLEVRPLFLPQLVQLTSMLKPGLRKITVCFYLI